MRRDDPRLCDSRGGIDTAALFPFHARVRKLPLAFLCLAILGCSSARPPIRQVEKIRSLPIALDPAFAFRKIKQYFLDPAALAQRGPIDASVAFEKSYRFYGAVTALDQRQRYGNYYDFFWRAARPAEVTVRFEYRQEKLHALVQAREIRYPNGRGAHESSFAVIGDDFADDGRVIAWRATLIVEGRVVALKRSYLWE